MKKRIDPGYLISLLLSVVLAFVIGAVILAIAGFSPGKAYLAMLNGAFSSARHIGDLLEYAMVGSFICSGRNYIQWQHR